MRGDACGSTVAAVTVDITERSFNKDSAVSKYIYMKKNFILIVQIL